MSEFTLRVAFEIFVAKLLDPFATVPALVAGYFAGPGGRSSLPQRRLE